ncbi:MAG: RluA family pseudouridine synthase [Candidatus Pacebacteria bacterium]|nr:RluA family pseudouridine synthase [Candidatus Paceibacterota bacterium]
MSGREQVDVPVSFDGERLDRFLAASFPEHSRSFLQSCIREQRVRVNGDLSRPATRISAGDSVTIVWPPPEDHTLRPEPLSLDVIYEDDDVLVLNKPSGLVVHPTDTIREGTLVHGLLHHDREAFGGMVDKTLRPGIVHRLDRDTSGVLVVAKNLTARRRLKEVWKAREVEKTYLAVVLGEFGSVTGTMDGKIGRNPRNRKKMAVVDVNGKRAVTHYRVLAGTGQVSLLEIRIETGRTHQIRVHFAHLNHPVLGDALYGGKQRDFAVSVPRQMLHAWKLTFPHPASGVMREYRAPLPADFCDVLEATGLPLIDACAVRKTDGPDSD